MGKLHLPAGPGQAGWRRPEIVVLAATIMVWCRGAGAAPAAGEAGCGLRSLAGLMYLLGQDAPTLAGDLTSLADLQRAASAHGLTLTLAHGTTADAASLTVPAIAHLKNPDHFTVLLDGGAEWFLVWDGGNTQVQIIDRAAWDERFSGYVALPASGEAAPKSSLRVEAALYEVGRIALGSTTRLGFSIANRGPQALRLEVERSTCGCTVAIERALIIEPGATGVVAVDYQPSTLGTDVQTIWLRADDPVWKRLALTVRAGVVAPAARWQPRNLFLQCEPGGSVSAAASLETPPDTPVREVFLEGIAGAAKLVQRSRQPGFDRYEFVVELETPPVGTQRGGLVARLGGETDLLVSAPVIVDVPPGIRLSRSGIVAGVLPRDEVFTTELTVRSTDARPFRIVNLECDREWVRATVVSGLEDGTLYQLRVVAQGGVPGLRQAVLRLRTDRPFEREMVVPITLLRE
ncbi:MAG: DUF1573 domain-containing protein [Armatimonadetes bacterium]|nr:DUF1573 domain-containing protein [Armatimonadota bacterium]